ncbi:hypothetical protein A3C23_00415 [Candidatus Roizmanbacteria bacterium RIFCSPHIGHO2_02_FULL_37_13b]|uniref:Metallo-beta-lactamase domain-containing protein n=1 Tax=Candidatus Roizmanbacteria bacterium RIFCSPLOWO2_02_FULL_36_11 TaxID=1802071 RepID=A0A1F7JBR6_9BACT|nr:MAG: hypothetical protein A3C23_00415 [Candidatus Roizmanbacteria bacterium RIFCSPHIGHO2_02_FULL_37_13b]OGK53068.1 MAG: hypothetical protein A3H78_00070 [Candidatus Roizmanbacteria bacterium RIFCSPLOWO2_02_FULL_36_11]
MNEPAISLKTLLMTGFVFLFLSLVLVGLSIINNKTKIVFCDVGQGDGAYIRTVNNIDILIDAGPSKNILTCLGKYMPLYDRTIEYALLSHFQTDHYGGYSYILERYKINNFIITKSQNKTKKAQELSKLIKQKVRSTIEIQSGDKIVLSNKSGLLFLWPDKEVMSYLTDTNETSQVVLFYQDNFQALFTGDITPDRLSMILHTKLHLAQGDRLDVLKIPHHGSRHNLNKQILELADPILSVISVGKSNSYNLPSSDVLDLLKTLKLSFLLTSELGDVIIEYKSGSWQIKK